MTARGATPVSLFEAVAGRPRLAALLGALCIAFAAIFVRFADVTPSTATVFRCAYALPALGLLAVLETRRHGARDRRQRLLALVAGLLFAADLTAFHHSIGLVGAGLATVLANLQVVLVGLAAWLVWGERPERRVILAAPVALLGAVLISGVIGREAYGADPPLGVASGLLAALFYAGYLLLLRGGGRDPRHAVGPVFDATVASVVGGVVLGAAMGDVDLVPRWPAHGWLLALALVAQVAGGLLIFASLPRLPAVLTSLILTVQPVATLVLGAVLLAESPSLVQLVGVFLIVVGLLVAATAGPRPVTAAPALSRAPSAPR